ncbi:MAG: isocitrate/isopropylmalate family dehydrogenase [Candidatus Micrarchaeia archaeon]
MSDAAGTLIEDIVVLGSVEIGDNAAMFEPVHGTAPKYAGKGVTNPIGMINAGVMLLMFLGWSEAVNTIEAALSKALSERKVTQDLAKVYGTSPLGTKEFAQNII